MWELAHLIVVLKLREHLLVGESSSLNELVGQMLHVLSIFLLTIVFCFAPILYCLCSIIALVELRNLYFGINLRADFLTKLHAASEILFPCFNLLRIQVLLLYFLSRYQCLSGFNLRGSPGLIMTGRAFELLIWWSTLRLGDFI